MKEQLNKVVEEEINGIIYMCLNLVTGKMYIGQSKNSLSYRKSQHYRSAKYDLKKRKPLSRFAKAILKHKKEDLIWLVIDKAKTISVLNKKEIYWISFFNSTDRLTGYNLDKGGNNKLSNEESKEKLRLKQKERVNSENYVNPFLGKTHSEETKINLSKIRKGRTALNKGIPMSEKQKSLLSELGLKRAKNTKQTEYIKQQKTSKTILCIQTEEVFLSIRDCARKMNLSQGNLNQHILGNKKNQTVKGYTFKILYKKND